MGDSDDLPGFYRDPDTGRYYAIPTNPTSIQLSFIAKVEKLKRKNRSFNRKPIEIIMHPATCKKKKVHGILDVIKSYEDGLTNKRDFKVQVTKVKLRQLRQQEKISIMKDDNEPYFNIGNNLYSCEAVIGHDKSYVAAWKVGSSSVVRTIGFDPNRCSASNTMGKALYSESYSYTFGSCNVAHMHPVRMNADQWVLLCLNLNKPSVVTQNIFQLIRLAYTFTISSATDFKFESPKLLRCCTYSDRMKLIVVGTSDGIITNSISYTSYVNRSIQCFKCPKYDYSAVEFDCYENLLYCISSNGKMFTMDTRMSDPIDVAKVGRGISCLKILSDNYTLLLSGYDNNLLNIDLRMKKTACVYPGHINQHRKIPFSFNEESSILCSAGQDNVTRFWDLYRGEPLASLEPPVESNNQLFAQLHVKNHKLYSHLFVDDEIFSYEPFS